MIIGRGAGIILLSNNKSVLLQHRDKNNRWNQDSWSEFGGQIEKKEIPEKAARRELKEELGIDIKDLKFFKKYNLKRVKGVYEQFVFIALVDSPIEVLKKQQKEGNDLAFFTEKEINNLKMADYTKRILKDFFQA